MSNESNPVKISHFQLAALLAVSALFTMTTTFPGMGDFSMSRFITLGISAAAMLLLYTPLMIFTSRNPGGAFSANLPVFRWIFGIVIVLRLLFAALVCTLQLKAFITKTAMPFLPSLFYMIIIFAVVVYGASKGIQASARIAPVSLAVYVAAVALVSFMMWNKFEITRLYSPLAGVRFTFDDVLRNDELFFFAVLCGFVRGKENHAGEKRGLAYKTVLYYLGAALALGLWLNFLYNGVLGRFIDSVYYPMYTVATFTSFNVIERMHGVFAMAGVIAGVLKITLAFLCIRAVLTDLFGIAPRERAAKITTWILVGAITFAAYFLIGHEPAVTSGHNAFFITTIAAVVLLPVTALFKKYKGKHNEKYM
jgi:hypothetical protein